MTYPLPLERIRKFVAGVDRCVVIEEGDPILVNDLRAAGIPVEGKPEEYRFGELNVARVRRIIAGESEPPAAPPKGKLPALCVGCPHRNVFEVLRDLGCIVSGDIGCYSLGVLPPFEALDTCICMGAAIGAGLGMRHVLPDEQARKVVSVLGDSTFMHSGLTGLAEMVYNPPKTGHVLLILDNNTTAMTGLQEHPGTGRTLAHQPTNTVYPEKVAEAMGIESVHVIDPRTEADRFRKTLEHALNEPQLTVIVARRPCILAAAKIKQYAQAQEKECSNV